LMLIEMTCLISLTVLLHRNSQWHQGQSGLLLVSDAVVIL
jgi:hypothetical protein